MGEREIQHLSARADWPTPVASVISVTLFSLPIVPRYAEIDQQGGVVNGHYLTWFDEACTGFIEHRGLT